MATTKRKGLTKRKVANPVRKFAVGWEHDSEFLVVHAKTEAEALESFSEDNESEFACSDRDKIMICDLSVMARYETRTRFVKVK